MSWKDQIWGCFGNADGLFANHPLDANRAYRLLGVLIEEHVTWSQAKTAVKQAMADNNCGRRLIAEQMKKVRAHWKPWLSE